jgi:hypothetical protein
LKGCVCTCVETVGERVAAYARVSVHACGSVRAFLHADSPMCLHACGPACMNANHMHAFYKCTLLQLDDTISGNSTQRTIRVSTRPTLFSSANTVTRGRTRIQSPARPALQTGSWRTAEPSIQHEAGGETNRAEEDGDTGRPC